MLIAVKGWDGFELWIEASLVMSIKRHVDSTTINPKCMVNMKCETASTASEEWVLADDADRVRRAVDEANAAGEARCKASPPAGCSATHPSEAVNPPHECKWPSGHTGWHTCKHCDFNWTTPPANTMADDLPNNAVRGAAEPRTLDGLVGGKVDR